MYAVKRLKQNPLISPTPLNASGVNHSFDSHAAFNGCPAEIKGGKIALLYRALAEPVRFDNGMFTLSSIGKAISSDGIRFPAASRKPFIIPEETWERYGCEDPRVTKLGSKHYIFYTALSSFPLSPDAIKVGLAISKDGLETISEKHLVTPFNSKAMVLFPERLDGKLTVLLTFDQDKGFSKIAIAQFNKEEEMWSEKYWDAWYKDSGKYVINIPHDQNVQLEIGAAPIKTDKGWLLVYSHIQDYHTDNKIFGIEAVLLDAKNPRKVVAQTNGPILVPEEYYEKEGIVPRVTFPSGALLFDKGKKLRIYYGAADTHCAAAELVLEDLLQSMILGAASGMKRLDTKPMFSPDPEHAWEKKAVFNPAALEIDGKIYLLYRAMSDDNTSTMGCVVTENGRDVSSRLPMPVYAPRVPLEMKNVPGGNSGCEDPRLVLMDDDRIYMCYTAYDGTDVPAVALTSISKKDFIECASDMLAIMQNKWTLPKIVSPDKIDDKDACIFPETIGGKNGAAGSAVGKGVTSDTSEKYCLLHRVHNAICIDFSDTLDFKNRNSFENKAIIEARPGMWDGLKVGISAPPIRTAKGWLLIYHGVSHYNYRVGAALLDINDPSIVLSRTADYILGPEESYELKGQVDNVVFPCGAVVRGDTIFTYYGGADSVVAVATVSMKKLLKALTF